MTVMKGYDLMAKLINWDLMKAHVYESDDYFECTVCGYREEWAFATYTDIENMYQHLQGVHPERLTLAALSR